MVTKKVTNSVYTTKSGFPEVWKPAYLLEPHIGFEPMTLSLRKSRQPFSVCFYTFF